MLSRIANSLFWMGRYLERVEHTARYAKVHYFSSLDAPLAQNKEFILESILTMVGNLDDYKLNNDQIVDEEVVYSIALEESNPLSIQYSISMARENARGARDSISGELWESINKFYHFINNHSRADLRRTGIFNFTEKIVEHCAIVNGHIDKSLLHNENWAFIHLGIHIERSNQITRILISKIKDIQRINDETIYEAAENYQCVTLLKSAEAFDMSRTYYQALPNLRDTIDFLVLNNDFPRAIRYNLSRLSKYLGKINPSKLEERDSLEFFVGRISSTFQYLQIDEIENDLLGFLDNTLCDINRIGDMLSEKYLNY